MLSTAQKVASQSAAADELDAGGNLLLSPFVEPHIHLDAALTAGEPRWNQSGTLFEGIECWGERKAMLSRRRARQAEKLDMSRGSQTR